MSSIGGGTSPGSPRRRRMKACCWVVNRRRASASLAAATTFSTSIAYGSRCRFEGRKSRWYTASAWSIAAGAKCEANANGSPRCAASCALNRLEPSSHTGTSIPAPGTARTACPGSAGSNQCSNSCTSCGNASALSK